MQRRFATLTLIGTDKAGVIAAITQLLFRLNANIEGLEEQVLRRQFSMTLQASWPASDFHRERITEELREAARTLGMELKLHFPTPGHKRLAILVTKESHVLKALLAATGKFPRTRMNQIGAEPVVVIGSRPDLAPLARQAKLPFHLVNSRDRVEAENETLALLDRYEVDFVVLARYMKILSPNFVWRWKNKIINIHPSLLPAFPGANAYRQAYEKGVKIVGVTAHLVTPSLDEGPILTQDALKIKPEESLASIVKRGQALESKCLLRALKAVISKRLDVHWGRVFGI